MRNRRGHSQLFALLLLVTGLCLVSVGCESNTEGADSYWVNYVVRTEAQASGSAVIDHVFYEDEDGSQTVAIDPPEADWSQVAILAPGDTIYLRAEGTVDAGRLVLQIEVQADNGSTFVRTANNMPTSDGPVFIEIPAETLP